MTAEDNDPGKGDAPRGEGEMSEAEIDRNLRDTFPASDPPSWTLGTDHREESPTEDSGDKDDLPRH